jgi:hypothetical protein
MTHRAYKKIFKAKEDGFGALWQAETAIKIEDLRSNKTTSKFS